MSRAVVLVDGGGMSLYLRDVRPAIGFPRLGYVVNGAWNWELRDGIELAKSGNHIVNRWPLRDYILVEVPASVRGGYEAVIDWAKKQLKES